MAQRKLASIQRIESLEPIQGADFILKARVMGWDVVVRKGEFRKRDLCVFFEVDSVLPDGAPWAEFMRPRKFRVKTCKLRGVLSQGLALPLDILPEEYREPYMGPHGPVGPQIGDDVSEELGVRKHEIVPHDGGAKMGQALGPFPHFVPKTDEIRVQSCLPVLDELKGEPYAITVKCDGTSGTFVHHEGELLVCSRNFAKKKDDTNIYWQVVRKYGLEEKLAARPGIALQGEICGPGLQRNRLMTIEPDLWVFNAYDWQARRHLAHDALVSLCDELGLKMVPVEEVGEEFSYTLEELLSKADGKYEGTKNNREGLVIRHRYGMYSPTLQGRLSFKVISNRFLLKDED